MTSKLLKHLLVSAVCCALGIKLVFGQNGVSAFGIQFKPIFPLDLVNTGGQSLLGDDGKSRLEIDEKGGFSAGAIIRVGLSKRFSVETGINYNRRNYSFLLTSPDYPAATADLSLATYEIPLIGMIFVRLGEKMFMNASTGIVFDLLPTGGLVGYARDSIEFGILESNWIIPALSANFGFEYRTEKNGYFYLGTSYHQPFSNFATVYISYRKPGTNDYESLFDPAPQLSGNYLTIDLRYFFNPGMKEKRDD